MAQVTLSGRVVDERTASPLVGATIADSLKQYVAVTDDQGRFVISRIPLGRYVFQVRFLGFSQKNISLDLQADYQLEVSLAENPLWGQEVRVYATRVTEENPVAFTTMSRAEINGLNVGRDMPFILAQTPSLITQSDAGTGVGYTGMRIRGSEATRINVTLNGIPMNDSESHGVFWVNVPDIASSAQSIQVQRGVGTSTNGAGAFGASVNIDTDQPAEKRYLDVINSYGSFNTHRHTVQASTGLFARDRLRVDARLSLIGSDGFIDRSAADMRSFYVSGKYSGQRTQALFIVFGGHELTHQSWNGVPESRLRNDQTAMLATAQVENWNEAQTANLLRSNSRTFNLYTYENQVDNYTQTHYQAHISRLLGSFLKANLSLHYTRGKGYFEEFAHAQPWSNYGVSPPAIGTSSPASTDLVRRRWLDNHFFGFTYHVDYIRNRYKSILGGGWNRYAGESFGQVIWAQLALTIPKDFRYYDSHGEKYDFNIFSKNEYRITPRLSAFVDLQYRRVDYKIRGAEPINGPPVNVATDVHYDFFNPKAGLTYAISAEHRVYVSYGIAHREPVRDDFVNALNKRPKPEALYDLEVGWRMRRKNYAINLNGYWMRYEDQLVAAGQINHSGASIRTGVPRSYRLGIELDGSWQPISKIGWRANLSWSENQIIDFHETIYDYGEQFDQKTPIIRRLGNTAISFSPALIIGSSLSYMLIAGLTATWMAKYVSEQFLDNTSSPSRRIKPYFVNDLLLSYKLSLRAIRKLEMVVVIQNLFDARYEANGYTYGYLAGSQTVRQNYYFPQAGIHYSITLAIGL